MADQHQHQHQHQQPLAHEKPNLVAAAPVSRGWYIAKITLGSISLVLSIALVAFSGVTWSALNGLLTELAWTAPATVLAICWQTAEFVTLCARRRTPAGAFLRRGIHPGAHIAVHLLCWIGFTAIFIVNAYNVATLYILRDGRSYPSGSNGWYSTNFPAKSGYVRSEQYWTITIAALSLAGILLIIHFTLFIRACIETHYRNSTGRSVQVVYVQQPAAQYYQPAGPGYHGQYASPPPQQQQQQQYPVSAVQSPPPAHNRDYPTGQHNNDDYDSQQQQQQQQQQQLPAKPQSYA